MIQFVCGVGMVLAWAEIRKMMKRDPCVLSFYQLVVRGVIASELSGRASCDKMPINRYQ